MVSLHWCCIVIALTVEGQEGCEYCRVKCRHTLLICRWVCVDKRVDISVCSYLTQ